MSEPRKPATLRYFGKYLLLGEIAAGGMGVVYRAEQPSANRSVALKMIRSGALAGEAERRRFRTEAEAAAGLSHPNIVKIFEIGEHEGQPFFSMELIEGESLSERISNFKSQISNRQAATLLLTIARAVYHAHQRGILHRDLKPANILLDESGEPHLTDFGLAKCLHADNGQTQTFAVLGTPAYMAPELAAGGARDATMASDVYSLGAILYELLAGSPPHVGATPAEILHKITTEDPPPPSRNTQHASHPAGQTPRRVNRKSPIVDRDLETICLKCLEREPARRYATAESLAEDLERWHRGEPILARPVSRWERAWKWVRRNPVVSALLAIIAVGLVISATAVTWQWRRAETGWATVSRANTRLLLQRAEEHFARDESPLALAALARALRDAPDNRAVEERLVNALQSRRFLIPVAGSNAIFDLAIDSQTSARIARSGTITADATSATNILVTGQPFATAPFILTPPKSGIIRHVALSPDTHWLVAAVAEVGVCTWDIRNQKLVGTFPHPATATTVDFDPLARFIATGAEDGVLRLWRLNQAEPLSSATAHRGPLNVARFSSDGCLLFTAGEDGLVRCWDPATLQPVSEPRHVNAPVDDLLFVEAGVAALRLRDNRVPWFALSQFQPAQPAPIFNSQFSIFNPTNSPPSLLPVETVLGVASTNFHADTITFTNFSADGSRLVTASADGTVRVWDTRTRLPLTPPMAHGATVNHARFSPDGLRVATSTADQTARVWDAATGTPLTGTLKAEGAVFSVRFSEDCREVIASNGQRWPLHHGGRRASDWLAALAEALAGQRVNPMGVLEPVAHEEAAAFFRRLSAEQQSGPHFAWLRALLPPP